jgi:hypothetical protein
MPRSAVVISIAALLLALLVLMPQLVQSSPNPTAVEPAPTGNARLEWSALICTDTL